MRYIGKLAANIDPRGPHGFIKLASVRRDDGSPHDLDTRKDIFIHQSDCSNPLRPGMEVEFSAYGDDRRQKAYRARNANETLSSQIVGLEEGGIELHLQSASNEDVRVLEHSSVFVSWCLSPELVGRIKEQMLGGNVVRLLILTFPVSERHRMGRERRLLVDPFAPLAFLPFDRGGPHRVLALLVWEKTEDKLTNLYLKSTDSSWSTDVLDDYGAKVLLEHGRERTSGSTYWTGTGCVQLEVPEVLFAKKPWDAGWLTWMNGTPLKDQCDTWRRRIFYAYHVQVLFFLVCCVVVLGNWLLALLSVILRTSFGLDSNPGPLRSPWSEGFWMTWKYEDDTTWFAFRLKGHRVGLPLAVAPGTLLLIATVAFLVTSGHQHHFAWSWSRFVHYWLIVASVWSLACFVIFLLDSRDRYAAEMRKIEADAARRKREEEELERYLATLVCDPASPRRPDVQNLPLTPRTFRFRVLAHKQEHCQAYAKD